MTSYVAPPGSIPTLGVPTLEGVRSVHLVGIGGAGMCGVARLLIARGIAVAGSDIKESRALEELRARGATIFIGHRPEHVSEAGIPDAVVVSTAIAETNPELAEARRLRIPVFARAQILAALMRGHRTAAVSGTHGKTTATSMLAVILEHAGLDPTFVIGGDLNESGSGARHGEGEWFVAEADESDGSFLLFEPDVAVATNIEEDHLDFYRDGDQIRAAFAAFFERSRAVVACGDDPGVRDALARSGRDALTYGFGEDNRVRMSSSDDEAVPSRAALELDGNKTEIELRSGGAHNLLDAAAAAAAASFAGVPLEASAEALRSFTGVRRRYEFRGMARGAEFVDDYAHHPTEVAATLAAVPRRYRRVVAVFQPHRFTRTRALWRALGESLRQADLVVVTDVYGAGEDPVPGVTGKLIVDALAEAAPGKRVVYLPRRSDIAPFLASEVRAGDVVVTLGAGDVTMVADETLHALAEAS